jgi:hypothetical protein
MTVAENGFDLARRRQPSGRHDGPAEAGHDRRHVSVLSPFRRTVIVAAGIVLASCNRTPRTEPAVVQAAPAAAGSTAGSVPHGDHNPHHGGIVMMKGDDLHYEVAPDPTGRAHHVYFTDAIRDDLPASVASDVVLTIHRPKAPDERVALQIDDTGESWVGSGRAVADPAAASVRLAFSIRHEPYWIDLPFTAGK